MYEDIIERLSDRRRVFDGAIIHVDHMTATLPKERKRFAKLPCILALLRLYR